MPRMNIPLNMEWVLAGMRVLERGWGRGERTSVVGIVAFVYQQPPLPPPPRPRFLAIVHLRSCSLMSGMQSPPEHGPMSGTCCLG
jgi:hypothetical protein